VRTTLFTPCDTTEREDWFLVVGALEPYKRTDLAIEAAVRGGHGLKVVGVGTQMESLRRSCPPGVEFLGRVPDEELLRLYRGAAALLFPQVEDFGIVAVEAQACGCPVIALARGGATEIVQEDTGLFVQEQTPEAFAAAMEEAGRWSVDDSVCRRNAERFSSEIFDAAVGRHVDELLGTRA